MLAEKETVFNTGIQHLYRLKLNLFAGNYLSGLL